MSRTRALELGCGHAVVRATLLGPAQILYSKLHHRGFGAPVRDLYDMAVAWQGARGALAIAVNARPERLVGTAAWTVSTAVENRPAFHDR